jgi:hypothetical protein
MDGRGSGVRDSRSGGVRHGRGCVGDCRGGVGDCGGGGVAQGGARTGHCDQSGEGDELKEEKDYMRNVFRYWSLMHFWDTLHGHLL